MRRAWWPASVVFLLAFGYRFLSFRDFPNDHFVYVARAQQILLGDWPGRDFVDPGFFLMYLSSAAMQALLGHNLVGEALLVFGGFALGAALTFQLVRACTASVAVAALTSTLQVLAFPRSYSYPKLPLHACALLLSWAYLARPTRALRFTLAGLTVIGFLFRPDHGVAIGLVAGGAILLQGRASFEERLRALAEYALAAVLLLLPWMVFVQGSAGLVAFFRSAVGFTGNKVAAGAVGWPVAPLTWAVGNSIPDLNHESLLYYAFQILPVAGAVVLWLRRDGVGPLKEDNRRLGLVVLLAIFVNATLLRDPLSNRLADVAVPQGILAAWLLSEMWRSCRFAAGRWLMRGAAICAAAILMLAVVRFGSVQDRMGDIPVFRPGALVERARLIGWALRNVDESAGIAKATPLPLLVQYVRACTNPSDRMMYMGYSPETYFLARRGFAGGQAVFEGAYYTSREEQALTISRLERERVPVVAMREASAEDLRKGFDLVARHIQTNYVLAGRLGRPGGEDDLIFVDRSIQPEGIYQPLGLPCYAPQ